MRKSPKTLQTKPGEKNTKSTLRQLTGGCLKNTRPIFFYLAEFNPASPTGRDQQKNIQMISHVQKIYPHQVPPCLLVKSHICLLDHHSISIKCHILW